MRAILVLLAAMVAVAYAAGQYYVPRSYYTIDSDGHETAPVPLRRLRRSVGPYPYDATPHTNADAYGGRGGDAQAIAIAGSGYRGYPGFGAGLGASNPNTLRAGMTRSQSGPVVGRSVSASTSVGIDSSGTGYYDQTASVGN